MNTINPSLKFFINLATVQAIVSRRFDGRLGGLGLNEFMILYHLSQANQEKLRRVDLADMLGLTASGVTRILLPMEKVGLIKRELNENDARVSYAAIAPGGKIKLSEALERAELFSEELLPSSNIKRSPGLSKILIELGGTLR